MDILRYLGSLVMNGLQLVILLVKIITIKDVGVLRIVGKEPVVLCLLLKRLGWVDVDRQLVSIVK